MRREMAAMYKELMKEERKERRSRRLLQAVVNNPELHSIATEILVQKIEEQEAQSKSHPPDRK